MLRSRNRLISLRITEEEYDAIRQASVEGGARCVSEFARNALLGSAALPSVKGTPEPAICNAMSGLDSRLTRVEKELEQVAGELHAHLNEPGTGRE